LIIFPFKVKTVLNVLSKDLQVTLWKKRYNFEKANEIVKRVQKMAQEKHDTFTKMCAAKQENKVAQLDVPQGVDVPQGASGTGVTVIPKKKL
jgi:hypothetical protein